MEENKMKDRILIEEGSTLLDERLGWMSVELEGRLGGRYFVPRSEEDTFVESLALGQTSFRFPCYREKGLIEFQDGDLYWDCMEYVAVTDRDVLREVGPAFQRYIAKGLIEPCESYCMI
jgi:hypothetical protein